MVTKEQAMTARSFIQTKAYTCTKQWRNGVLMNVPVPGSEYTLVKPVNWRANGKCKTWKREANRHKFQLPIKFGLYECGYITEENAHLFEVA